MTSSDGTVVTLVGGGTIVDTMGNQWSISASGQVVENGVTDTFTSNVTELAFKNSVIWQENTSFLWYAKVGNAPGAYHGWAAGTYAAPVPIDNTWIGGGNNSAANANDWSHHIAPRPGDTLTMTGGVMNLTGNQLQGDALNVAMGATVTLNVSGQTYMVLHDGSYGPAAIATVNIASGGTWSGTVDNSLGSNVIVQGAGKFANTGTSMIDGHATFGTDVVGVGTILALASHGPGRMEFAHGVSSGQTVKLDNSYGLQGGFVQVDAPSQFHASVVMDMGELVLKGLHATSAAYDGSTLSLFNGSSMVDKVAIKTGAPAYGPPDTLHVAQSASGNIDIFKSIAMPVGDTLLPMHA